MAEDEEGLVKPLILELNENCALLASLKVLLLAVMNRAVGDDVDTKTLEVPETVCNDELATVEVMVLLADVTPGAFVLLELIDSLETLLSLPEGIGKSVLVVVEFKLPVA
jgi:hypothetical protein